MSYNFKRALEDLQYEDLSTERFLKAVIAEIESNKITFDEICIIEFTLVKITNYYYLRVKYATSHGRKYVMSRTYHDNKQKAELVFCEIKKKLKKEGFKISEKEPDDEDVIKKLVIVF